jgi:hypothetical protein
MLRNSCRVPLHRYSLAGVAVIATACLAGCATPLHAERTYWGEVDENGKIVATNAVPAPVPGFNGTNLYSLVFDRKILSFVASANKRFTGQVNPYTVFVETGVADPNEFKQHQAVVATYILDDCQAGLKTCRLTATKAGYSFIVVLAD